MNRNCVNRLFSLVWLSLLIPGCLGAREPKQEAVARPASFVLWQLPNQTHSQMMSYVIKTTGGKIIVIDGGTTGDAAYLKGFLAALGNDVEAWFMSHAHSDHFEALGEILSMPDAPRIKTLYGSMSSLEWTKQHCYSASADVTPYEKYLEAVRRANLHEVDLPLGADFRIDNVRIEVLGVRNPEITVNALNNSSMVWRMSDEVKSVLFTGDLGAEGGRKLMDSPYAARLPSDYVQMAHHGQEGVDETFYRAVNPKYCLWTTPLRLWDNDNGGGKGSGPWKTLEVRAWMDKLAIKQHYVILEGLCRIE